MQDSYTGDMVPLKSEFFKDIPKAKSFEERLELTTAALKAAKNEAQPIKERQGPVFMEGETLFIRGGRFRVLKIHKRGINLESMPSFPATAPPPASSTDQQ